MRAKEIVARIEKYGGVFVRQVGSHRRYNASAFDGTKVFTTVPMHSGDVPLGTLKAIQKDLEPVFGKGLARKMSTQKYVATVSKEGNAWTVQCHEYPQAHTWAKTLTGLRSAIREAIILAADLEENAAFSVNLIADDSVPKDFADALAIDNERATLEVQPEKPRTRVLSAAMDA